MSKKISTIITLAIFINFIISCSTIRTVNRNEVVEIAPSVKIKAVKLQEVQLTTTRGELTGKLLSLEGEILQMLLFPYWDVEPINIDLNEIYSIKLMKKNSRAGKNAAASGFAWGFLITGIATGLDSEYDEDFEDALLGSAIIGGFIGLLGFVIGGLSDIATKSKYYFFQMSNSEKIRVIKKIMGL